MAEDYVHKPIDILELQLAASTLQNEVLMRYVTNPKNLLPIREILTATFQKLSCLEVPETEVMCPDGWVHAMCRCIVPPMKEVCYVEEHSKM